MKEVIIQIQGLTKKFGSSFALKNLNLVVHRQEVFGIIGMSGAGKSTLIRCLTSLTRPTEGHVYLGDQDLSSLPETELREARRKIGMIFQHFNLFSARSVLDNVAYPLEIQGVEKKVRYKKAYELLELVGLKGKEHFYPAQLSGGQKQRVAIARALAGDPDVLLCDEATSALDPTTTHSILMLLSELNRRLGLTIVLITHEMEVIKQICSHVAVLEHGEIIEQGTSLELFSHPSHPTTKRFLQSLTHDIPDYISTEGDLLRLFFTDRCVSQPIISRLIKEFPVEVNILLGGIDVLHEGTVGNLVIALTGSSDARSQACCFLEDAGVKWEKIK